MAWRCGVEKAWCEEGGVVQIKGCGAEKEERIWGVTCGKGGEGMWCVEMSEVEVHNGHAMNTASSPW